MERESGEGERGGERGEREGEGERERERETERERERGEREHNLVFNNRTECEIVQMNAALITHLCHICTI